MATIFKYLHNVTNVTNFIRIGPSLAEVSDGPIRTKFVTSVQNHIPMTTKSSKSKLKVEFLYGICFFSKCGSSTSSISAMD